MIPSPIHTNQRASEKIKDNTSVSNRNFFKDKLLRNRCLFSSKEILMETNLSSLNKVLS